MTRIRGSDGHDKCTKKQFARTGGQKFDKMVKMLADVSCSVCDCLLLLLLRAIGNLQPPDLLVFHS